MFSDEEFQDLFFLTQQQMYQFRTAVVVPMLAQRAAQAQGARGARNSLPHSLTPDSLACLFLMKLRLNPTDRELAAEFGITAKLVRKWLVALRNYYFTTDQFIQRNQNLGIQANMDAILRQGIDATSRCPRTTAQYGHLQHPNTQLLVVIMDSRAVKIQQSRDAHLQKRSISTKINNNSVQKLTISTSEGTPLITFPLMCSISPAGTDESNSTWWPLGFSVLTIQSFAIGTLCLNMFWWTFKKGLAGRIGTFSGLILDQDLLSLFAPKCRIA